MPANIPLIDGIYIYTERILLADIKIFSFFFIKKKTFIISITIRKFGDIRWSNIEKREELATY